MYKSIFAALSMCSLVILGSGSALAGMENPETNHASYWGDSCNKTEISGDIKEYTVTKSGINKVIVKGGTSYVVYEDGNFTNLTAPENTKNGKTYGISHIIECEDPATPVDPQEPTKPVDPSCPTKPTKPTEPTEPIEPTEPVNPTDPVQPVEPVGEAEEPTVPVTPEGGKGGPSELPTELPKTGADSNFAAFFTIATGASILISLVGYKGALSFITGRLNS